VGALQPEVIHLRWGDGLGCPSSQRKYRDTDQRVTAHRVRLATRSRSRPHWLDETLNADEVIPIAMAPRRGDDRNVIGGRHRPLERPAEFVADRDDASVRSAITGAGEVAFRLPDGLKRSKNPFRSC
jgi:hypothetical protein